MLEIQFAEIPEEGMALKIDDVSWFPDREVARSGDLRAEVFLERSGATRILVRGSIEVNLALACDRCLEEFVRPERFDFRLIMELVQAGSDSELEDCDHGSDRNGTEVVIVDRPVVDLADLFCQQLFLALPRKILCRTDCQGLCEKCGANLNHEGCGCPGKSDFSPFGALGRLLKE